MRSGIRRASLDIPASVSHAATASVLVREEDRRAARDTLQYLALLAALAGVDSNGRLAESRHRAAATGTLLDITQDPVKFVSLCFTHWRFLTRWWTHLVADMRSGSVDGGPSFLSPDQRAQLSSALSPNPLRASLVEQLLRGLGFSVAATTAATIDVTDPNFSASATSTSTAALVAAARTTHSFSSLGGAGGLSVLPSKQRQRNNDGLVHSPYGTMRAGSSTITMTPTTKQQQQQHSPSSRMTFRTSMTEVVEGSDGDDAYDFEHYTFFENVAGGKQYQCRYPLCGASFSSVAKAAAHASLAHDDSAPRRQDRPQQHLLQGGSSGSSRVDELSPVGLSSSTQTVSFQDSAKTPIASRNSMRTVSKADALVAPLYLAAGGQPVRAFNGNTGIASNAKVNANVELKRA